MAFLTVALSNAVRLPCVTDDCRCSSRFQCRVPSKRESAGSSCSPSLSIRTKLFLFPKKNVWYRRSVSRIHASTTPPLRPKTADFQHMSPVFNTVVILLSYVHSFAKIRSFADDVPLSNNVFCVTRASVSRNLFAEVL